MSDLLDQIEARADDARRNRESYSKESRPRRITQEDSAQDVPRLLAAVRAVEQVVNRLGRVGGDVSQPAPSYYVSVGRKVVADEVRRALTEALEGK